jgi:hypothetical protein
MARALTAVGIALVLLMGGLGLAVYLTRDENYLAVDNLLAERITKAIGTAEDRGANVDLRRLAPFAWDHILLVARGVEPAAISRRLGYKWNGRIGFQTGELMLFMVRGKVVRFADYRGEGHFAGFQQPFASIPRARAVWRVRDLVIRPARPAATVRTASTAPGRPGPPPPTRARG